MAMMIPADVSSFKTKGEEKVYNFLKIAAKPDDQFISWYSSEIGGNKLDFLLFSNSLGIIVLEVKDWSIGQIEKAGKSTFLVKKGKKLISYTNPIDQAKDYNDAIRNIIEKDGVLVQKNEHHMGRCKIPVDHGVIFTNIFRRSFIDQKLDKVIDAEKVFFWDDLHPDSHIVFDKSGDYFRRVIQKKFPPKFSCQISDTEMLYLKKLLYPIVTVSDPRRDKSDIFEKRMDELRVLDNNQEAIARQYDDGHRLIKGSSGTGKSILLVHKVAFLKKNNPAIKKVLMLCYNLTLSHYLRRLVFDKGVPIGEDGVDVWSFYEFCGHILKEPVDHNIHDDDYYQTILEQAMEEAGNMGLSYDAILIDESQDFTDNMMSFVKQLLNPKTNNLTLVIDENQNIYRRKLSWKKLGFNFAGKRTCVLKYVYRSTVELNTFVKKYLNCSENLLSDGKNGQMEMFPGYGEFHGPDPFMIQFDTLETLLGYVINEIKQLVYSEVIPLNQISIIYTSKYFSDPNRTELINAITTALNTNGLFFHWVSQDSRAKMSYDVTANRIALSSIHSLKGFDHSCVFLLGLDMLKANKWTKAQIDMMTYVAISRARDRLYIPYTEKTGLIEKLLESISVLTAQ